MQKVLIILSRFETYANLELFEKVFGRMGVHLWNQFRLKHNHNIVAFYCALDTVQEARLVNYLNSKLQARTTGLKVAV